VFFCFWKPQCRRQHLPAKQKDRTGERERESEREIYRRQTDLTVKPLFIADDLECNADVELVIIGVNNLTKAAFAKHFAHLIAIGNVISRYLQQNHQLKPVK